MKKGMLTPWVQKCRWKPFRYQRKTRFLPSLRETRGHLPYQSHELCRCALQAPCQITRSEKANFLHKETYRANIAQDQWTSCKWGRSSRIARTSADLFEELLFLSADNVPMKISSMPASAEFRLSKIRVRCLMQVEQKLSDEEAEDCSWVTASQRCWQYIATKFFSFIPNAQQQLTPMTVETYTVHV